MADVYATIEKADQGVQVQLADILELRAADLQQRAMLEDYLADLPLPRGARVLEIGCGPGPVARALAARPGIGEVVGIDPSLVFIERARIRAEGIPNLSFVTGDGRELPFDDRCFDAVVCHTSLCHIPGPELVLAEARRVTVPGGLLAISTVTTRPRPSPSTTTIRSRPAPPVRSTRWYTTAGSYAGSPAWSARPASTSCASEAMATSRLPIPITC